MYIYVHVYIKKSIKIIIYIISYSQIKWIVESANARIKQWNYLGHILPSSQIPFIGDFIKIVCSICNRFVCDNNLLFVILNIK